jgi:small subunit ribosomal protein S20
MKTAEKARVLNRSIIKKLKVALKTFIAAVKANDLEKAKADMKIAESLFDRAGTKGYIHRNKAARVKSRMAARLAKATQG